MTKHSSKFNFESDFISKFGFRKLKNKTTKQERWIDIILPADREAGHIETQADKRPLKILSLFIYIVVAILILQLGIIQLIKGKYNLNLANGNRIRQKIIYAPRGIIYDRNKNVLAENLAALDVSIIPAFLPKSENTRKQIYQNLSNYIPLDQNTIKVKAEAQNLNWPNPIVIYTNLNRTMALKLDQDLNQFPGVSLDAVPLRSYTDISLAHFLGYIGKVNQADLERNNNYQIYDYIGKSGLEAAYENQLKGVNGSEQIEVDASGRPISLLASKAASIGEGLTLTVDEALQKKLTQEMEKQINNSDSKKAAAIALNPKTGEILAAVSLPGFDNNLFAHGISDDNYNKLIQNSSQPLFNKVVNGSYPVGSTIKPFVATAALEEKTISPETTIIDNGQIEIPNPYNPNIKYTFKGWDSTGLGVMNIYRAIAFSSDIYFYTVGGGFEKFIGLGVEKLTNWYSRFGFGRKTGIDLPSETNGRVPTPAWKQKTLKEPWYTGDTYNISVGQGDILISPLQLATATAAIANGGILFKPYLVSQILDAKGNIIKINQPKIIKDNIASSANLAIIRQAMRQTVTKGTACCQFDSQVPVAVAGKTGTAETEPGKKKPNAWFTAFAPYEDPKIVLAVLVENSGEGAEYAMPVARKVLSWYFSNH